MPRWSVLLYASIFFAACDSTARDPNESQLGRSFGRDELTASAERESFAENTGPRIVILGDSLTAGLGLTTEEAYPSRLQARVDRLGADLDVVPAAVSGDTTAGGLSRLQWALEGDVRWLVVALGGNDGLRGLPLGQMKANLEEIVENATMQGIDVLIAGMEAPPNFGEAYTDAFRQIFRDIAEERGLAFVPFLLEGVAGLPEFNQSDGIHPNAIGAERVAAHLWTTLEPIVVNEFLEPVSGPMIQREHDND